MPNCDGRFWAIGKLVGGPARLVEPRAGTICTARRTWRWVEEPAAPEEARRHPHGAPQPGLAGPARTTAAGTLWNGFGLHRQRLLEPCQKTRPWKVTRGRSHSAFIRGLMPSWNLATYPARVHTEGGERPARASGATPTSIRPRLDWVQPCSGHLVQVAQGLVQGDTNTLPPQPQILSVHAGRVGHRPRSGLEAAGRRRSSIPGSQAAFPGSRALSLGSRAKKLLAKETGSHSPVRRRTAGSRSRTSWGQAARIPGADGTIKR